MGRRGERGYYRVLGQAGRKTWTSRNRSRYSTGFNTLVYMNRLRSSFKNVKLYVK